MNTFKSFDGTRIAYHDEGRGPAVSTPSSSSFKNNGVSADASRHRKIDLLPESGAIPKRALSFRVIFVS